MTAATSQGRTVRTVRVRGGREYVEVHERVRLAHDEGGYTTLEPFVYPIGERWFYRAGIVVDGQTFYGTAEIKFGAKPGTADGDSPIECAETSAYGRAFAFAGIGILDSIASADEMQRGQPRQHPQSPVVRKQEDESASGQAKPETLNAIAKACELLKIAVPTNIESEQDAQQRLELYRQEWRKQAKENAKAQAKKAWPNAPEQQAAEPESAPAY